MIKNPILPGFNPDPCICRKGDDYYLLTSSFEWLPGLPVYHSRDLKHWEIISHILTDEKALGLHNLPSAKGVWAPCLTYCEQDDLFYVIYGVMNSMNGGYFDINNYLITSKSICGSWSEPVYLHSAGFDASIYHGDDGRKWIVSLEWETRENKTKPGEICIAEYLPSEKRIAENPKRIWNGCTKRGSIEAPHIFKHGDYYYLMCAEGGTGYGHCATCARSKNVCGPYEADPNGYIITSTPGELNERGNIDHFKRQHYNKDLTLQKAGHGSYVETQNGEHYLVFHVGRPFVPELRCTLGRESCIAKMVWSEDGWLRTEDGTGLASEYCNEPMLPEYKSKEIPERDDFNKDRLGLEYYSPRLMPQRISSLADREGYLRIYGNESLCSLNKVGFVARRLTSVYADVTVKLEFEPEVYQHSAGIAVYYDNMDYIYLKKYRSTSMDCAALNVEAMENGERRIYGRTEIKDGVPVYLRIKMRGRSVRFEFGYDGKDFKDLGVELDLSKLSDEYCTYGEFTGTSVGMVCIDRLFHRKYADFDFFEYKADETKNVE